MRDKETGLAGGSLQARSDDQLSGLISSSNNLSANANQAQLISSIKAHIARGDKAAKKAEDHYIAAGQYLAALKKEHAGSWAEWAELLKTKVCISTGRASELMQIADGRKTVEGLAAASTERSKKHRALSSLRNEENADGRKSVEEMLAMQRNASENFWSIWRPTKTSFARSFLRYVAKKMPATRKPRLRSLPLAHC